MHSYRLTKRPKRNITDIVAFTFDNSTKHRLIFQVSSFIIYRLPIGDFRQNFSRQNFFSLAMATKMVAAWSTGNGPVGADGHMSHRMVTLSLSKLMLWVHARTIFPSSQYQTLCRSSNACLQLPCCGSGCIQFCYVGQGSHRPDGQWPGWNGHSVCWLKWPLSLHFGSLLGFLRMLCWHQHVGSLWRWPATI